MTEQLNAFFDRFVADIPSFDGAVIGERYQVPYMAVSTNGAAWLCTTPEEVAEYFQSVLDRHQSRGVKSCTWEDLSYQEVGSHCYLATVTWTMRDGDGQPVSNWRESYNMMKTPQGLKIFTSIDH